MWYQKFVSAYGHWLAARSGDLADAKQAIHSVHNVRKQLLLLGRRYRIIPIRVNGSFHPKLCIRIGASEAVAACGSHNLTRSGWLGLRRSDSSGGNREATLTWRVRPQTYASAQLRHVIEELSKLTDTDGDKEQIGSLLNANVLATSGDVREEPWMVAVGGNERSLASVLEERWRGREFERLRVICGSTDESGAMIRWAASTFGISKAIVEIDRHSCAFDPKKIADVPVDLRLVPYDGNPRSHLKMALFESATDSAAVVGSPNCSGAAWLRRRNEGGNIEAGRQEREVAASQIEGDDADVLHERTPSILFCECPRRLHATASAMAERGVRNPALNVALNRKLRSGHFGAVAGSSATDLGVTTPAHTAKSRKALKNRGLPTGFSPSPLMKVSRLL